MPATAPSATAATPVAAMAAPTARKCCHGQPCAIASHATKSVGAGMPATATSATAATPVAAMAAPTARKSCHRQPRAIASHVICGSRHAGDGTLRYSCDPGRCHGSSHSEEVLSLPVMCHRQPCDLWEPACRRLQPPLRPRPRSLPWQLPQRGSAAMASHVPSPVMQRNLWEPACRRLHPPLLPRHRSLPWQLPQRGSAAIASHVPSPAM